MKMEIRIPEVGESVREAVLAQWYKRDGETIRRGDVLFLIETDKVTLEIAADGDGVLHIIAREGETVAIGAVVGIIDTEESPRAAAPATSPEAAREESAAAAGSEQAVREALGFEKPSEPSAAPLARPVPGPAAESGRLEPSEERLAPSVRRLIAEKGIDASRITGTGPDGRITRGDVLLYMEEASGRAEARERPAGRPPAAQEAPAPPSPAHPLPIEAAEEPVTRKAMSRIRQRIAERLLEAKQNTAMLTTFNEIDMSRVQDLRSRFKEAFRARYGASLGLMSFFVRASVVALKEIPEVNAFIDGKEVVYHHYYHIGVAVGSERGLVVPVVRHADRLSFAQIEQSISGFVKKIKENRLELSDLEGGTFTISNGGVYGSLLSTPILNPPQTGILGMHKIEDRPVAVDGQIVIRPMMYVALSYDHRLVDGAEAVTFLKRIKECVEHPERIMMEI